MHLLNFIESEAVKKVLFLKAITDSIIASAASTPEALDGAHTSVKAYIQMALPSLLQKDKIESIEQLDKEDLKNIKLRLTKARAQMKK